MPNMVRALGGGGWTQLIVIVGHYRGSRTKGECLNDEVGNPKSEARNPKQIQRSQLLQTANKTNDRFGFRASCLFRISCFGFRISSLARARSSLAESPR